MGHWHISFDDAKPKLSSWLHMHTTLRVLRITTACWKTSIYQKKICRRWNLKERWKTGQTWNTHLHRRQRPATRRASTNCSGRGQIRIQYCAFVASVVAHFKRLTITSASQLGQWRLLASTAATLESFSHNTIYCWLYSALALVITAALEVLDCSLWE